jgi:hypothetical protein
VAEDHKGGGQTRRPNGASCNGCALRQAIGILRDDQFFVRRDHPSRHRRGVGRNPSFFTVCLYIRSVINNQPAPLSTGCQSESRPFSKPLNTSLGQSLPIVIDDFEFERRSARRIERECSSGIRRGRLPTALRRNAFRGSPRNSSRPSAGRFGVDSGSILPRMCRIPGRDASDHSVVALILHCWPHLATFGWESGSPSGSEESHLAGNGRQSPEKR